MGEFFELLDEEVQLFQAHAKLATARFKNAIARTEIAVRRWKVEGDYEGLQERLPRILGDTEMGDISAVHFICIPPSGSGEERRYTSNYSILSKPDRSLDELEQIRQADQDFHDYFYSLPPGSQISMTFVDKKNRVLGTTTGRIK